jgi:hypothetical protein
MTFTEFKTELISRYRKNEFDQFLHLLIKASDWSELLTLLKKEPLKYIVYGIQKGIISENFLLEIPQIERENAKIFNSVQSITNSTDTIFLFGNAELNLIQNLSNRCKVVLIGNAQLFASCLDTSMIEVDLNQNSTAEIDAVDSSFLYLSIGENSTAEITGSNNATIKSIHNGDSNANILLSDSSFINATTKWFSQLNIDCPNNNNYVTKKQDESVINITNGIPV